MQKLTGHHSKRRIFKFSPFVFSAILLLLLFNMAAGMETETDDHARTVTIDCATGVIGTAVARAVIAFSETGESEVHDDLVHVPMVAIDPEYAHE